MEAGLCIIQALAKSEHLWGLNRNTGFPIDSSSLLETLVLSAAPKSFDSVGYISSCLLDELNSGSKHVNVKPPQGPPSSLVLADTQNLIKQFGPSPLQFKASMCCVYAS